jgi:hypothetical protein
MGRVLVHAALVQMSAALLSQDDQHQENLKRRRGNSKEIDGYQAFQMIF